MDANGGHLGLMALKPQFFEPRSGGVGRAVAAGIARPEPVYYVRSRVYPGPERHRQRQFPGGAVERRGPQPGLPVAVARSNQPGSSMPASTGIVPGGGTQPAA